MRVKVRYLGLVWKKIGKKGEELEIKDGSSLSELLDELAKIYGESLKGLFNAEKENLIDPTYIVTVNGVLADRLEGLRTKLRTEDEVALMTLISGG